MNYLTNYYKNLSEELQTKVNFLEQQLNELTATFVPAISSDTQSYADPNNPDVSVPVKNKNRRLQKTGKKLVEDAAHTATHNNDKLKSAEELARKNEETEFLKTQYENLMKQFANLVPNQNLRSIGKNAGVVPQFSSIYDYLQHSLQSDKETPEPTLFATTKKMGPASERQEF